MIENNDLLTRESFDDAIINNINSIDNKIFANSCTSLQDYINKFDDNGNKTIELGAGTFEFTSQTLTNLHGITIKGQGTSQTFIKYNGSGSLFTIKGCQYIKFRDISFIGSIDDNSTCFNIHMEVGKDEATHQFTFENCVFQRWYKAISFTGNEMCSETSFIKCRFLQNYYCIELDNFQSLNHQFFGCDFESHDLNTLTSKDISEGAVFLVKSGGTINLIGGSIITPYTTFLFKPEKMSALIRSSQAMYTLNGCRFEQLINSENNVIFREECLDSLKQGNTIQLNIINCMYFLRSSSINNYTGILNNGMNISMSNFISNNECKVKGIVDIYTKSVNGSLISDSNIDYVEVRNTSEIEPTHNIKAKNFTKVRRNEPINIKRIYYQTLNGDIIANSSYTFTLPIGSTLDKIIIVRGQAGGSNSTYKATDKLGNDLGTTVIPFSGGSGKIENYNYVATEDNNTITITASGSGVLPKGKIYIDYY